MPGPGRTRPSHWALPLHVAGLAVLVAGEGVGLHAVSAAAAAAASPAAVASPAAAPVRPAHRGPPPAVLLVPALDLRSAVVPVGTGADGTLQVPGDDTRTGWYDDGPAPGEAGPAVLVGHVDNRRGPAVFARLHSLRAGDLVQVQRRDGTVAAFAVTGVRSYPKAAFPTELVYRGSAGRATLRLVTCGGPFDRTAHSYRDNVVVFAARTPAAG